MSAEILREAAALMRARAKAATPGPWEGQSRKAGVVCCGMTAETNCWPRGDHHVMSVRPVGHPSWAWLEGVMGHNSTNTAAANSEHIASWHPAVALAVADWLDMVADYLERAVNGRHPGWKATVHHAEAVATAYLGTAT